MAAAVDPRLPCIVGVAQRTFRPEELGPAPAPEPLAMWEEVARAAAADSRRPGLVERLESLQVVYCQTWPYDDPVGRLAERLGCSPRQRRYSGIGGTVPLALVEEAAAAIARGDADLALVVGAEALASRARLKKAGERLPYSHRHPNPPPFPFEAPFHPAELAHEVLPAWLTFALFDVARRAALGVPPADYRAGIGRLLAPLTEVAAANPYAWFREARTAEELVAPSPSNRMVGYPYTKRMVAVMDVDMAAAVLLSSHGFANQAGVPPDRRVYLRGVATASDPVYVAEHPELASSPAMRAASFAALAAAGVGLDDVDWLDLYSCFPSSLHFACDALGLRPGDPRPLSVTGGLPYAGGPGSNYVTHALAAMTEKLRAGGGTGLVSGVGMHMTRHAFAVVSSEPGPLGRPEPAAVQREADRAGRARIVEQAPGRATVAAYSVVHDRSGEPAWGLLVCDVAEGVRCYARLEGQEGLKEAEAVELVGSEVDLEVDAKGRNLVRGLRRRGALAR
jgi:acetyl-CoA C-acetyltransferase